MKCNFLIKDAVFFEVSGKVLDKLNLVGIEVFRGTAQAVKTRWQVPCSNQQVIITFTEVTDFIVKGRDRQYPLESGIMLRIAGYSQGNIDEIDDLYITPSFDFAYMTFVMEDASAFLIKAETASLQRL
jgi:hypothetical protein